MTDTQAKIIIAMRRSNTAMTQAEIAKATDLDASKVLSDVLALGAMGYVRKSGSFFALTRSNR
jgi:DNA-binding IclR family transcriptional regulator